MVLSNIAYILFGLLIAGTILVILTDDDDNSSKKIAWIAVISLLPIIGLIAYLILGLNPRRTRKYNEHQKKFAEAFNKICDEATRDRLFGHSAESEAGSPASGILPGREHVRRKGVA